MAGLDREYQQDFTIGMAEETAKHDIDLCIFNCQGQAEVDVIRNDEGENAIFDLPDLNDFDGVVALCYTMVSGVALDHIKELLENISGKPTVTIDAPMDTAVEITFDDVTSVRELMEHLIHHHGYRRFGIVTGPMGNEVAMGRYHTSLEMLVENGCQLDYVFDGSWTRAGGRKAAKGMLADPKGLPDVVVCGNDDMAFGVIEYFNDLKIEQARLAIATTPKTFTEIAEELGFSSVGYFSKLFKAKVGMTPTAYSRYVSKRRAGI